MFFRRILGAVGRIFISAIFIISALNKIFGWDEVLETFVSTLHTWLLYGSSLMWLEEGIEMMVEFAPAILAIATALELVGGLMLLLGIRVRLASIFLILFLIPTTVLYHNFWYLYGEERNLQLIMFLKNCAIMGALINVVAIGRAIRKSEILDAISRSTT